jgi:hypothetical protein
VALLHQQWPFRLPGALDLPDCVSTVLHTVESIERADIGQESKLFSIESGNAENQIIDRSKGP